MESILMRSRTRKKRAGRLLSIAVLYLGLGLLGNGHGWCDSGLSLNLYTLEESHKFSANLQIPIIGVLKNEKRWPLNMDFGFSQMEIERYLIARDPQGIRHTPPFREIQASDMPPPSRWGQYETVPAEVLDTDWERSVTIDDLRELFPIMKKLSGWYTIEAELPYSRYGWTVKDESGSLLGVLDNKASHGTIKSKKLRIFVAPSRGGRMKIRAEDLSTPELTARSNVEIKIFNKSEVLEKESLADAWDSLEPITRGNTGQGGWVTLPAGGACLQEPAQEGDAYVAIARYKDEYKEAYIENGAQGWQTECGGLLTRYILFGEPPHQFSIFGLNSVWVRNKARILSGDVGVQKIGSDGPWLVPEFEVTFDVNAWVNEGSAIIGDTVLIRSTASVWEILCNQAGSEISGTVRLEDGVTYGLEPPVWGGVEGVFPSNQDFEGDKNDLSVNLNSSEELTLQPRLEGYGDVTLSSNSTLRLTGGEYDFLSLTMGSDSRLLCEGPTIIRIADRLYPGTKAFIKPTANSGVGADQIKIFINGENGKKGGLNDKPKAAHIGEGNTVEANIYANNGTLLIEEGCFLKGSFIGKDVIVGQKTVVEFNGGF